MDKLKTLKDIQNLYGFHNLKTINKEIAPVMKNRIVNGGIEMAIFPSYLKQEAIKWVKFLRNPPRPYTYEKRIIPFTKEQLEISKHQAKVFIRFFNITEEDLK